jgi:hypothetical protein
VHIALERKEEEGCQTVHDNFATIWQRSFTQPHSCRLHEFEI